MFLGVKNTKDKGFYRFPYPNNIIPILSAYHNFISPSLSKQWHMPIFLPYDR